MRFLHFLQPGQGSGWPLSSQEASAHETQAGPPEHALRPSPVPWGAGAAGVTRDAPVSLLSPLGNTRRATTKSRFFSAVCLS